MTHPNQPTYNDVNGTLRFKANAICRWLLDEGEKYGLDLNKIATVKTFSQEDRIQFAQLIGYSVCGWGELSYVTDEAYASVCTQINNPDTAKLQLLADSRQDVIDEAKENVRALCKTLYGFDPEEI